MPTSRLLNGRFLVWPTATRRSVQFGGLRHRLMVVAPTPRRWAAARLDRWAVASTASVIESNPAARNCVSRASRRACCAAGSVRRAPSRRAARTAARWSVRAGFGGSACEFGERRCRVPHRCQPIRILGDLGELGRSEDLAGLGAHEHGRGGQVVLGPILRGADLMGAKQVRPQRSEPTTADQAGDRMSGTIP